MIFNLVVLFLASPFLGDAVSAEETIVIRVPEKVTVVGPRLSIGDVADVSGNNRAVLERIRRVRLGKAAQTGTVLKLSRGQIKIALRREGLTAKGMVFEGPETIQVLTKSEEFSTDSLLSRVKAFVVRGLGESPENVEVKLAGVEKKILLPAGPVDANFRPPLSGKYEGPLLLTTELMVNGRLVRVVPLRVTVEVFRPVVVTTKRVEKGEKFTQGNVTVVRRPSTNVSHGSLQELDSVLGRTASLPLIPGSLLRISSLYDPPVVKRGQVLQAVVQRGNVEIMVGVRAIEEGKAGDSIRVENTQTRKILRGKILNEKLISIDDGKQ